MLVCKLTCAAWLGSRLDADSCYFRMLLQEHHSHIPPPRPTTLSPARPARPPPDGDMSGALRSAFSLYVKLNVGGFVGGDQRMNSQQFTKMCHDAGMMEPNGEAGGRGGRGTGLAAMSQGGPLDR